MFETLILLPVAIWGFMVVYAGVYEAIMSEEDEYEEVADYIVMNGVTYVAIDEED